jgi:hypothetical protein
MLFHSIQDKIPTKFFFVFFLLFFSLYLLISQIYIFIIPFNNKQSIASYLTLHMGVH